uniref:Uncharacterized protein n=1 Tax=Meloidogyne enterolobii TaxID=390850 RepID=A0A6V7UXM2_MELEN|nr:unnamed protein product [Meloidogyne enterolobii]
MFYSLPTETKLDIFKCLNHKELCSVKQTNLYFRHFINKFEGELAREEFSGIYIGHVNRLKEAPYKLIIPEAENFNFTLNEQFEEKWKKGLKTPISLFLPKKDSIKNAICLEKGKKFSLYGIDKSHILQLPTIIKNKNQMKDVYYYLNKLFNCSFTFGNFNEFIFNPELLQLLFGDTKQLYIRISYFLITDNNVESLFQFILNNLVGETLAIEFYLDKDILEKYRDTLFKILMIRGNNFKKVHLKFYNNQVIFNFVINVTTIYEHIVKCIATSRDCSKMPFINLNSNNLTSLELSKRAENVEIKQFSGSKYQIASIHNPEVRFSFRIKEWNGRTFHVKIRK